MQGRAVPARVIPSEVEESSQYDGARIPRCAPLTRNDIAGERYRAKRIGERIWITWCVLSAATRRRYRAVPRGSGDLLKADYASSADTVRRYRAKRIGERIWTTWCELSAGTCPLGVANTCHPERSRGPRARVLPVAEEARAQCVPRSARNEPALSGEVSAGHRKRTLRSTMVRGFLDALRLLGMT